MVGNNNKGYEQCIIDSNNNIIMSIFLNYIEIKHSVSSRLSWWKRQLQACVMRNMTGLSPAQPVTFYQYWLPYTRMSLLDYSVC